MPETSNPTVFVVDDEAVIASTLAAILNLSGFVATAFASPLKALRAGTERCPDFLISDVAMPDLNGIDLGVQFKSLHPACKVLLFSGHAATTDLLTKAGEQGHDFTLLTKPVHPKDLLAAIGTLKA